MPKTAIVNYHINTGDRQAFHIDAGGEQGRLLSPELVSTEVTLTDLRASEVSVSFAKNSVEFASNPSQISKFGADENWKPTYDREIKSFLAHRIGARETVVFDHTVRIDDPNVTRKPARNVHSDYSPAGAYQRLRDLLGQEEASEWDAGHFGFVNVWRPVQNMINSSPLGFVQPASVQAEDWITIDLIYPDRVGEIMGLVANHAHEWIYTSQMTPDDVAYFNIYDNHGLPSIAHSALDRVEDSTITTPRMSIESRTLVRY